MKLLDKLKNALFEEEYVEVEEVVKPTPKKKEKAPIVKKIELPEKRKEPAKINKMERDFSFENDFEEEQEKISVSDRELLKPEGTFKFPMTFEEEDFKPEFEQMVVEKPKPKVAPTPSVYEKKEEKVDLYQKRDYQLPEYGSYEKKEEKKVFRPSPIISPIYGVLDRNYKKEEIVQKKEVTISGYKRKMDIDAVREKAYGDLTNEIGLSMDEEEKKIDELEKTLDEFEEDDNLLFDMRDDSTPAISKVTVGDAEEYFQDLGLEYNIDYKDISKEKASGRRVYKNKEINEEQEDKTKETLEDNLFDLIDSMYEERD